MKIKTFNVSHASSHATLDDKRPGKVKAYVEFEIPGAWSTERPQVPITGRRLERLLTTMQELAIEELAFTAKRDDDAMIGDDNVKPQPDPKDEEIAELKRKLEQLAPPANEVIF